MYRAPVVAGSEWVPLNEAAARLSYLGASTRFVLEDMLGRGCVPVLAMRRDLPAILPDQVGDLLAKAGSLTVLSPKNVIVAHYQFASEQEAHQLLGPRSHFTQTIPDPSRRPLLVNVDFDQVRLCWATLLGELRRFGGAPDDELSLRKLGLWPGSSETVNGKKPANEAAEGVEPGGVLKPAPDAAIHKAITAAYDNAKTASAEQTDLPSDEKRVSNTRKRRGAYRGRLNSWMATQELGVLQKMGPAGIAREFETHCEHQLPELFSLLPKRRRSMESEVERIIKRRLEAARANAHPSQARR
jgi:hypothetical protein